MISGGVPGRHAEPEPRHHVETLDAAGIEGRQVRQMRRSCEARHRERLELAGPDFVDHGWNVEEAIVISPLTMRLIPSTETRCGTCLMSLPVIAANSAPER